MAAMYKTNEARTTEARTLPRGDEVNAQNAETTLSIERLSSVFEKAFDSLRHLASGCDLLIAMAPPLAQSCVAKWTSGAFSEFHKAEFSLDRGLLAQALHQHELSQIVSSELLAASNKEFQNLEPGTVAILRIDLAGDGFALILFFQPQKLGPITPEKLSALENFVQLTGLAATTEDLSLDIQTHQVYLDNLRDELAEVQQFYKLFSNAISQCFWILDTQAERVLLISDNFERVWGSPKTSLRTGLCGFIDSVSPVDRDRVLAEFHMNLDKELNLEFRVQDRDGEIRWMWLRGFPVTNMPDESLRTCVVLVADDVTDKKQEEELVRSKEVELATKAKNLAVGDLANGIAHEINNPLTIIMGRANEIQRTIKKNPIDAPKINEHAEKIQHTCVRISEIISSLQALGRQKHPVAMVSSSFAKIFHDIKDLCSEKFRSANVPLTIAEIPAHLHAEMNPTQISQLLLNLINNAFDAVKDQPVKWVNVDYTEDDHSVFFYVTDSGPGVPIKNRGRIFDPFFTTKSPGQGTGLGLSLASTIALHHHGSLRLDNLHVHTRFVVQLPKKQPRQQIAA